MKLQKQSIGSRARERSLHKVVGALTVLGTVTIAGTALAQAPQGKTSPAQRMPPASQGSNMNSMTNRPTTPHFSSKTIAKAGYAMKDIQKLNQKYMPEIKTAEEAKNNAKVQKIVQKYRKDAIGKLVSDGITPTKYQEVLTAARSNPMLRQQIMEAAGSIQKK